MAENSRWETGSEFHWVGQVDKPAKGKTAAWQDDGIFCGSGRDALRALVQFGRKENGWHRLLVPSFLCQEVVGAIASVGVDVAVYYDDPRAPIVAPKPSRGEVLFIVNTFGVRRRWVPYPDMYGAIVEDHTHDPWSEWATNSTSDYCIASLRKTLPIPDGGVLWSPKGLPLPPCPELSVQHRQAAGLKLEAMLLKSIYLEGGAVEKAHFRTPAVAGESGIATGAVSGMHPTSAAVVRSFPVTSWRERRRANHALLSERLQRVPGIEVLQPADPGSCPFSVILICRDGALREKLRKDLINQQVYPAVLWPLEPSVVPLPGESVDLSQRILSIHCDGRYSPEDMVHVAEAIERTLA